MLENKSNSSNNFVPPPPTNAEIQEKNKYTSPRKKRDVIILALFLGFIGVHDFYTGNTKNGIIKLLLSLSAILSPIATLWTVFDLFKIASGDYTDGQGRKLQ